MLATSCAPAAAPAGSRRGVAVLATAQLVIALDYSIANLAPPDIGWASLLGRDGPVGDQRVHLTFGGFLLLGGRAAGPARPATHGHGGALPVRDELPGGRLAQHASVLIVAGAAQGVGGRCCCPSTPADTP